MYNQQNERKEKEHGKEKRKRQRLSAHERRESQELVNG